MSRMNRQFLSTRFLSTVRDIYFGTPSLNRHSFLRTDPSFISKALTSPQANYIFLDNLAPVVDVKHNKLFTLNYETVGHDNRCILDQWAEFNEKKSSDLKSMPLIHFLGLDQRHFSPFKYKDYTGAPYFAIDVSKHRSFSERVSKTPDIKVLETRELVNQHLDYYESNVFAQGKMYIDWLSSTKHCKGCGAQTIPINAGSELLCSSYLEKTPCPVKGAPVSNASFPRLDPVLITCVLNQNHSKVLFTRLSKFPRGMYTHIAGFIEPGETIEAAVAREVWEEAGLTISNVQIVRSQPWPYPANIMVGCVATVECEEWDLSHDMELEEALWVDLDLTREIVKHGVEDENLTVIREGIEWGIPNDKTLAFKLFEWVVDNYHKS